MALEILSQPMTEPDAGLFNLPEEFDRVLHVSKWVLKGHAVNQAQRRENLLGANITADGWTVFKGPKGAIHTAITQKGEYVLMFRLRSIQQDVNAVYGNVGKKRMLSEKQQATTSASQMQATGMLSDEQLRHAGYREDTQSQPQDGEVQLNPVNIQPRITAPVLDLTTNQQPPED